MAVPLLGASILYGDLGNTMYIKCSFPAFTVSTNM